MVFFKFDKLTVKIVVRLEVISEQLAFLFSSEYVLGVQRLNIHFKSSVFDGIKV